MSVWGKIIGSTTGFALGGPLGALIGAIAGHAVDKYNKKKLPEEVALKQIGFTIGIIALSAKMAKADGKVSIEEVLAFKKQVSIPEREIKNVGRLWDQAKKSTDGFEIYASQLASLFKPKSAVLEEIIHLLFNIAASDGSITKDENLYIKKVSSIFGFNDYDFNVINSNYSKNGFDPYKVLGVKKNYTLKKINQKRLKLIKANHPDKLLSQGLPNEFIENNLRKLKIINNAWEEIKKNHS